MGDSDFDLEILAVPAASDNGDALANVGDTSDGAGVAAGISLYGQSGFYGGPCPADGNGGAASVLVATLGRRRVVMGCNDERQIGALPGPARTASDRFILSTCAARFELRAANNTVGLYSPDLKVEVDGAADKAHIASSHVKVEVDAGAQTGQMTFDDGAGTLAEVVVATSKVFLNYTAAAVSCNIQLLPGGIVAITAPGGVTVNGIPLVVP